MISTQMCYLCPRTLRYLSPKSKQLFWGRVGVGVKAVLNLCENRFFLEAAKKNRNEEAPKKGHLALRRSTPTSVLPQDTGEEVKSVPTTLLLEGRLGGGQKRSTTSRRDGRDRFCREPVIRMHGGRSNYPAPVTRRRHNTNIRQRSRCSRRFHCRCMKFRRA